MVGLFIMGRIKTCSSWTGATDVRQRSRRSPVDPGRGDRSADDITEQLKVASVIQAAR